MKHKYESYVGNDASYVSPFLGQSKWKNGSEEKERKVCWLDGA